jgi:hypothetical protein
VIAPLVLATLAALRIPGPLTPRSARYEVHATVDAGWVSARERITWTNPASVATSELVLQLPTGGVISHLRVEGAEFTAALRTDGGIGRLPLSRAIAPAASITLEVELKSPLRGDGELLELRDWLPRVAVFDCHAPFASPCGSERQCRWRARPHDATEEVLAESGLFDVVLDLPAGRTWGSTGVLLAERTSGQRTILTLRAEDVVDFAFVAHPQFRAHEMEIADPWGAVQVRLLALPGHESDVPRHLRALREGLPDYERRFGPYPYSLLTVIDLPDGGGMEYPTLFFTPESRSPSGIHTPEYVTLHELAHQWFYGLVATDQTDEPWLDEGLAMAASDRELATLFGADRGMVDLFGLHASLAERVRMEFRRSPEAAPILAATKHALPMPQFHAIAYAKAHLALRTVEGLMGRARFDEALRTYVDRGLRAHPDSNDFVCSFNDVPKGFWQQALGTTAILDREVVEIRGSTVTVRNNGALRLPVTLRARFADGSEQEAFWDGDSPAHSFEFSHNGIVEAEVDPDRNMLLDLSRWNDGLRAASDGRQRERLRSIHQGLASLLLSLVGY